MPGIFESQSRDMVQAMMVMANDLNRRGQITGIHKGTGVRNSNLEVVLPNTNRSINK